MLRECPSCGRREDERNFWKAFCSRSCAWVYFWRKRHGYKVNDL